MWCWPTWRQALGTADSAANNLERQVSFWSKRSARKLTSGLTAAACLFLANEEQKNAALSVGTKSKVLPGVATPNPEKFTGRHSKLGARCQLAVPPSPIVLTILLRIKPAKPYSDAKISALGRPGPKHANPPVDPLRGCLKTQKTSRRQGFGRQIRRCQRYDPLLFRLH